MIWVDKNEELKCNVPQLLTDIGVPIIVGSTPPNQPNFDYVINNEFAVERKTVSDYFQSKSSGHLDNQLTEMSTNFPLSFVVIVGEDDYPTVESYLKKNGIPLQVWMGTYLGTQTKRSQDGLSGVVIVNQCRNEMDFALYLKTLHDRSEDGNFVRLPKFVASRASPQDIAINVLCSFKNVGKTKAVEILKKHHSLGDALLMLLMGNSWDVKGVGEKTQKGILEIMNHKYGE